MVRCLASLLLIPWFLLAQEPGFGKQNSSTRISGVETCPRCAQESDGKSWSFADGQTLARILRSEFHSHLCHGYDIYLIAVGRGKWDNVCRTSGTVRGAWANDESYVLFFLSIKLLGNQSKESGGEKAELWKYGGHFWPKGEYLSLYKEATRLKKFF